MSARRIKGINLLPKDSFEESDLGQFLRWALVTGRAVVVITELVVILAFASRFWFDKTLNDLMEVIDQKQALVQSYRTVEEQMRQVLIREAPITMALENNLEIETTLAQLVRATPIEVNFTKMNLSITGLSLAGQSSSEEGLAAFLSNLNKIEKVKKLSMGEIKFSQRDGKIEFDLTASFKDEAGKK
jgi:Tfp pilus assembly protein PilN